MDTIQDAKNRASKIIRHHPIQVIENPVKQAKKFIDVKRAKISKKIVQKVLQKDKSFDFLAKSDAKTNRIELIENINSNSNSVSFLPQIAPNYRTSIKIKED